MSSSSEESTNLDAGGLFSRSPVIVGTTMVKSSSAFDGLDENRLLVVFDLAGLFAGLGRGDGATLLAVLFAGLV